MISSSSSWQSPEEYGEVYLDEFFLKKEEFPGLYKEAEDQFKEKKSQSAVIEQLSPKGLALMSYLYAQKDKKEAQPLIASTITDFEHIITLIDNAVAGTIVTVILQPTDSESPFFSYLHKTVFRFEKTGTCIETIHMDGTNNHRYGSLCRDYIVEILGKNATTLQKDKTKLNFYLQNNVENNVNYSRQVDKYRCGIFATKDARQLNKETTTSISTHFIFLEDKYKLPSQYLKSIQSKMYFNHVLQEHGQKIVTKNGETLEQVRKKHEPFGYVQHFSEKYHRKVEEFFYENSNNPGFIKKAVAQYDAGKMTPERLATVYGPTVHRSIEDETVIQGHSPSSFTF